MSHGTLLDASQLAERLIESRQQLDKARIQATDSLLRWALVITVTLPAEALALQHLRPLAMFIPGITLIGIVGVVHAMMQMIRLSEYLEVDTRALRATLPLMTRLKNELSLSVLAAEIVKIKVQRGYHAMGLAAPDDPAAAPTVKPQVEPTISQPPVALAKPEVAPEPKPAPPTRNQDAMDFEQHVNFGKDAKPPTD